MADHGLQQLIAPLSVRRALSGKNILITGASGFLAKVWLAMILHQLPETGRIYVLMRRQGFASAAARLNHLLNTSPVFGPLHESGKLAGVIKGRLFAVEGDVEAGCLGMDPLTCNQLLGEIDLFIHCAGVVSFDADIRQALGVNVEGARQVGEFVRASKRAKLLHVSTCFVAGMTDGEIPESLEINQSPSGAPFDALDEIRHLRNEITSVMERHNEPWMIERAQSRAERAMARGAHHDRSLEEQTAHEQRRLLEQDMTSVGMTRAQILGWPNSYTLSKGMAERVLARMLPRERLLIFRPAIVESALRFPFPGWNEGFNTSGPLIWLLGSWFRFFPGGATVPFDISPVDEVCRGMGIAAAALLRGEHPLVAQCGSYHANPLSVGRTVELTALGHRKYYRQHGENWVERWVLSRWDAAGADEDHALSVPRLRLYSHAAAGSLKGLSKSGPGWLRAPASSLAKSLESGERNLAKIDRMLNLYKPFINDHRQIFRTDFLLNTAVEEPEWRFDPMSIDWAHFWMDVHMPGVRRWCYPELLGGKLETIAPAQPVSVREWSIAAGEAAEAAQ
ncbi:MAG: hypothetical protein GMKNLPBB_00069 [Myxococcota bacterium]|nr:hypothetical protein [Myxococcota bacterium]